MVHRQVHTLFIIKQIRKESWLVMYTLADNVHIRVGPQWTHSSPVGLKHQSTLWYESLIINT